MFTENVMAMKSRIGLVPSYHINYHISLPVSVVQGSHKPGKPGIVREFCKPTKVREFEIWSVNFL